MYDFYKDGRIFDKEYMERATNILLNSFIKTILNQTNKDFECCIITHPKSINYVKQIKFPLNVSVFTYSELIENIKKHICEYDYIIHTTCDYDDFFHKDNVKLIKQSIGSDTNFKIFGFTKGATLVYGEHVPYIFSPNYLGTTGFFSCCTSIIYSTKLNYTNEFPFLIHDVAKKYNGAHPNWKNIIKEEYKNWGIEKLDDDFFDYPKDDVYRFIWIRQPMSYTTIKLTEGNKNMHESDKKIILNLKEDFGYNL